MRILFISQELIGSGLCLRLCREGHEVKLFINDTARKNCLEGFVAKIKSWRQELPWVGKDGLIIFDDVGFGEVQDTLRASGYNVFGGNTEGDRLELDRGYGQRIMHRAGIHILPSFNFNSIESAIEFVKENPVKWVVKQTSHISVLNHVGEKSDASDVIEVLRQYQTLAIPSVHLQKRAEGVEVGIARYFNGTDWVGPIEINHEHKRLYNGDLGPLTAEMGTVVWHSEDEKLPLYEKTLSKLKYHLQKINYRGDIDINCIVNDQNIWPLELTPRLGTPSTQLHCELYTSSMGNFLLAIAQGKKHKLTYKKNYYGIVHALAVAPFPYPPATKRRSDSQVKLRVAHTLSDNDSESLYVEEVSYRPTEDSRQEMYWAGEFGYLGYITSSATTIAAAQKTVAKRLAKVHVDNMIYRSDIGERVKNTDLPLLKKWGWI